MSAEADRRRSIWGALLFLSPVGCALFLMGAVDLVVTRDKGSIEKFTAGIKFETYSAKVAATMYHYAISLSLLGLACSTTLIICAYIVWTQWPALSKIERAYIKAGVVASALLPILLILISHITADCGTGQMKSGIEDCVGGRLIQLTIREGYSQVLQPPLPSFVGKHDSNFITFVVLFTYFIGTLASVTIATGAPVVPAAENAADTTERITKITVVLFAMAIVMAVAIVTMKLRFDLGLATMLPMSDGKPSPGQIGYQTIANATTTTWAWFLSIYLAMMYLPSLAAMHLRAAEIQWSGGPILGIGMPHVAKFARVIALLAPPIVAKAIEVVSA